MNEDIKPQDHPDFIGGWVWTKLEMRWIEDRIAKAIEEEREAIAKAIENAPALVEYAQNDRGGCLICGFTPKLAAEFIRARGTP